VIARRSLVSRLRPARCDKVEPRARSCRWRAVPSRAVRTARPTSTRVSRARSYLLGRAGGELWSEALACWRERGSLAGPGGPPSAASPAPAQRGAFLPHVTPALQLLVHLRLSQPPCKQLQEPEPL